MADQSKLVGQRTEPPLPSDDTLGRHGARILSPTKAPRLDQPPQTTSYVVDRLILPGNKKARKKARRAIKKASRGIRLKKIDCHLFELKDGSGHVVDPGQRLGAGYQLVPSGQGVVLADAWPVLEAARAGRKTNAAVRGASLDHLMFGPSVGGTAPYTSAHSTGGTAPYTSAHSTGGLALASYGQVGSGGRQVVNWVGPDPRRDPHMSPDRRPRVAFFDTGCGEHPWLKDGVERFTVGNESDKDDPEKYADQDSPLLGELDSHSGHGTFLAGIIRQYCPDADLMSIRVMKSDGVVKEWETLHALQAVAGAMQRWIDGKPGIRVDIVVLSLGYYLETPIDPYYTSLLRTVLQQFGRLGVAVVVASGNDATTREFYPAAFSPRQDEVDGTFKTPVPVIAVGSLNPDEASIALFNNHGPWIRAWEPGVSLVSTVPKMQGSLQPQVRLSETLPGEPFTRSSIDDDNFASGFALWSGTSFSAPLLAAKIAVALIGGEPPVRNAKAARKRGWGAVQQVTGIQLVRR